MPRVKARVKVIMKNNRKKEKRPLLNFDVEDDTLQFEDMMNFESNHDYDEENPPGTSDIEFYPPTTRTPREEVSILCGEEKYDEHNTAFYKDCHSDPIWDESCSISGIGDDLDCILSICLDNDTVKEWDIISENNSEWDLISDGDINSIESFDIVQSNTFSYKDALLKMNDLPPPVQEQSKGIAYTRRESDKGSKGGKDFKLRPVQEDVWEGMYDAYFDYHCYKGARGGKPSFKQRLC